MEVFADTIDKVSPYFNRKSLNAEGDSYTMRFLKREYQRILKNPSEEYTLIPDENNLLFWYFLIHGNQDTLYGSGCYLGCIILPPDFPFNAPEIQMISPTGRFRRRIPICLSITTHHPEGWKPSWNLDKIMIGFISFMYSKELSAGCIKYSEDDITSFAKVSKDWLYRSCNVFRTIFAEEYSILLKADKLGLSDKLFLNCTIRGEDRTNKIWQRLELYEKYTKEINISLAVYDESERKSLLCKYFSMITTNSQINQMEIIPCSLQESVGDDFQPSDEESEIEFETDEEESQNELETDVYEPNVGRSATSQDDRLLEMSDGESEASYKTSKSCLEDCVEAMSS